MEMASCDQVIGEKMSADLLFRLILGHLVGDYLFQTNWMALNKKESVLACGVHCFVWTACVMIFMWPELALLSVAGIIKVGVLLLASHWILDGSKLIDWWLTFIGSRDYASATRIYREGQASGMAPKKVFASFIISYTAIVQTVADNTLHLLFMYWIVNAFVIDT